MNFAFCLICWTKQEIIMYTEFWGYDETVPPESIKEKLCELKQANTDLILKPFSSHFT